MRGSMKITIGLAFALLAMALPQSALAFDAGVRTPLLADQAPAAVSVPFEIPVRQSAAVPQPLNFEIAVGGFTLDPDPVAGQRIGSFDLVTDSGEFNDKAIFSDGPATEGFRTWTIDWQLGEDPIIATIQDGTALDPDGHQIADPQSTLVSFTVPGNYHGFRLMGLSLRFNQQEKRESTPGVGAVNPPFPGKYLVRSRIQSVAPQSSVSVSSAWAAIGPSDPATAISVKAGRKVVRAGSKVGFRIRTTNETRDRVGIWLGGRLLRKFKVGPTAKTVSWKAPKKLAGRQIRLRFKPKNGPARIIKLRVTRR